MRPLRVLLTNTTLATRTGTELYVRDLALALTARGHVAMVYSPRLGPVSRVLARANIEVVDDLRQLSKAPEVIHGHHQLPTMAAFLHFPRVPGIFVCHDFIHDSDVPPVFPRILRYVAVDENCQHRLVKYRVPEDHIRVIFNGVDLRRFTERGRLPERPERALIFSNYASEGTHLGSVREACSQAGLRMDVLGARAGCSSDHPESILGEYDVVFAKGRCALEALAVGAAVILCDWPGSGPLVTRANLGRLYRWNFGWPALRGPLSVDSLVHEIARYDPNDAAEVSRRIRRSASLDAMTDELVLLYQEVLREYRMGANIGRPSEEIVAAKAYRAALRRQRIRNRIRNLPIAGRLLVALRRSLLTS